MPIIEKVATAKGQTTTPNAVRAFLEFLASDIRAHPERIRSVSPQLRARIEALIAGLEIDLNAPIEGAVAL